MKLKCEKEGNASANKWMEWNKNGKVSGSLSLVNGLSAEQSRAFAVYEMNGFEYVVVVLLSQLNSRLIYVLKSP